MKKALAVVFAGVIGNAAYAMPVSESTAMLAGKNFMTKYSQAGDEPVLLTSYMDNSSTYSAIYVFSANAGKGFVIVAGDDAVSPILGYSADFSFPTENVSPEVSYWMENYRKQISDVISASLTASQTIAEKWNGLLNGTAGRVAHRGTSVAPLVSTNWDQGTYYNKFCPGTGSAKTPTGCVATAMAIIMKYWNAPTTGTGSYSYTHSTYGAQSANFGETSYNWGSMPVVLNSSSSTESVDAVATLMYHCGVAVRMDYSPSGSGAQVIGWGTYPSARKAFKDYFGYKSTIEGVYREEYTTAAWIDMLKDQIDNGKPVLYAGFDDGFGAGHAFVFSGYDDDNLFHVNWGWSGYYNGYFTVDDLTPAGSGIGGGSGSYNDGQQALINIEPIGEGVMFDLALNSAIELSSPTVARMEPFSLMASIANLGTMDFMGRYTAAVYNSHDSLEGYVQRTSVITTDLGGFSAVSLSTTGMTLPDGEYYIKILYRASSESSWTELPESESFVNRINLTFAGEATSTSELSQLSADVKLYPNPASSFVNIDVANAKSKVTSISIYNTLGAKVYTANLGSSSMVKVPLSGMAAGVYFLNVVSDKGSITKQFSLK